MNINIEAIRKLRGLRIKQLRLEKKLTQEELSALSGVDRKTIINMECGENSWHVDTEILILEALNFVEL